MAILSPTFAPVIRDHVLEPSEFIDRETTGCPAEPPPSDPRSARASSTIPPVNSGLFSR